MSGVAEHIRQARRDLAAALEPLTPDQRIEAMKDACIETGGTFIPRGDFSSNWGAHYAEIQCLGVSHTGNDMAEAVANWIKAVFRVEDEHACLGEAA